MIFVQHWRDHSHGALRDAQRVSQGAHLITEPVLA